MVKKEGTVVVLSVQLGGRLKMEVSNALLAVRARLVWVVKIAQWGLHEREKTMPPNANDATQV